MENGEIKGRVHSVESFGTVDGPGIRLVVFLQGCPMRCLYCHNPDTWDRDGGEVMSVSEIISEYEKNRAFYQKGGITVTGGEPLWQMDFVTALFKEARAHGIHTCIDTSGITFSESEGVIEKFDSLMEYTSLVMLDIKHIDSERHKALTGVGNEKVIAFARYLEGKKIPLWVRHVIVQGYTDNTDELTRLGEFIGTLSNLAALDVLPYHTLGVKKYEELGLEYPLKGISPLPRERALEAKRTILAAIKKIRTKKEQI
jgi:pyruvate formate lyase activating enzyme